MKLKKQLKYNLLEKRIVIGEYDKVFVAIFNRWKKKVYRKGSKWTWDQITQYLDDVLQANLFNKFPKSLPDGKTGNINNYVISLNGISPIATFRDDHFGGNSQKAYKDLKANFRNARDAFGSLVENRNHDNMKLKEELNKINQKRLHSILNEQNKMGKWSKSEVGELIFALDDPKDYKWANNIFRKAASKFNMEHDRNRGHYVFYDISNKDAKMIKDGFNKTLESNEIYGTWEFI